MNGIKMSGIIRRFDDLGRIVVPREIRKLLQLHEGDAMEISVAGSTVRAVSCGFLQELPACLCHMRHRACACFQDHNHPERTHAVAVRKGPYPDAGAIPLQP